MSLATPDKIRDLQIKLYRKASALARNDSGLLMKSDPPKQAERNGFAGGQERSRIPKAAPQQGRPRDTKSLHAFGVDEIACFIPCPRASLVLRVGYRPCDIMSYLASRLKTIAVAPPRREYAGSWFDVLCEALPAGLLASPELPSESPMVPPE
jgi:hypothetical protein